MTVTFGDRDGVVCCEDEPFDFPKAYLAAEKVVRPTKAAHV